MNFKTALKYNQYSDKLLSIYIIPSRIKVIINKVKLGLIQSYLIKKYAPLVDHYKALHNNSIESKKTQERIIWVCWFQGFENAPEIVRRCLNNIVRFHGEDSTINMVTIDNYKNFVTLPAHIEDKFKYGLLKPALFADILRLSLLAKHGGIWIDSTVLILKPLPSEVFEKEFFSLKSTTYPSFSTVSYGKWTTFFLKAGQDNLTILFVRDMLIQYWEEHDEELDYYLFDHAISIAYNSFPSFKMKIDKINTLGNNRHLLMSLLFKEYDPKIDDLISQDTTQIYKLSYKFDPVLIQAEDTFYSRYIK